MLPSIFHNFLPTPSFYTKWWRSEGQFFQFSFSSRTKHGNCVKFLRLYFPVQDSVYSHFFSLLRYFLIQDSVYSLFSQGPSTKFLTPWKDSFLEQLLYLLPRIALMLYNMSCGHHSVVKTRTQFAVPLARIDLICPPDSECHLLRYLSTAVLGAEMNVSARVTLDTEFLCQCYAIQPQDFCCRI